MKTATKPISEETRIAILDAAWTLIARNGRLDVGQAEIAAKAGVSRQTVYLAFGGRAGLLFAMLRNRDRQSKQVKRLHEIAQSSDATPQALFDFLGAWLDYLPIIYPVGIQLDAASLHDSEAAAAWNDRMRDALLRGIRMMFGRIEAAGGLAPGWRAEAAADLTWSLVHPTAWRLLVIDSGWSAAAFRRSRFAIVERTLLATTGAAAEDVVSLQRRAARRRTREPTSR